MSIFETQTCGRCGGGGSYSFNLMHGSTCYGCGGSGKKLTKRGAAASAKFRELTTKPVADLKPGMFVWDDTFGYKPKWLPILSIEPSKSCCITNDGKVYYTDIKTKRSVHGVFPDSTVRALRDEADRKQAIEQALAYQATLGVTGKPLKAKKSTTTTTKEAVAA